MDKWLSKLDSSSWLSHIKDVLSSACLVAQCLDQEGEKNILTSFTTTNILTLSAEVSVLVHGAEGTDSTLQISSLSQVILNPDCRTVHGFEALVEREWLQAGHPFATRCKDSAYKQSNVRTREQSPIFLVFLDCVYQIYNQFSCSFEFNENFLILLFDNAYSSQFGTFLGNCVKERKELNLAKKTVSLWSYVNRPEVLKEYLNPLYEPNNSVLWPSVAPQSLELWKGMYCRWVIDSSPTKKALLKIKELINEEAELKAKAAKLRRSLALISQEGTV